MASTIYRGRTYVPGDTVWIRHVPSQQSMYGTIQDFAADEQGVMARIHFPFFGVQWIPLRDDFEMEPADEWV